MKKLIVIAIVSLLLIGCSPEIRYKYKYVEVKVPVQTPITPPPVLVKPILPINSLIDADKKDYPKISKAYAITIKRLKAYIEKQDKSLDAYRTTEN